MLCLALLVSGTARMLLYLTPNIAELLLWLWLWSLALVQFQVLRSVSILCSNRNFLEVISAYSNL
jgi:hypothetical protein